MRVISFLIAFALIGCHQDNPNPLAEPTGPSGTLTSAQAAAFVGTAGSTVGTGSAQVLLSTAMSTSTSVIGNFVALSSSAFHHTQRAPSSCTPLVSGDQTDADGDSLPVNATYTYNCSDPSQGGLNVTGAYTLSDQNDNSAFPLAGFYLNVSNLSVTSATGSGGQSTGTATVNTLGNYNLTITGANLTSSAAFVQNYTSNPSNGGSQSGVFKYFLDTTSTADDPTNPATSGQSNLQGYFVGQYGSLNVVLQVNASAITYNHTCTLTYFNNGSISLLDGAGNTLAFTYTNCNLVQTFNGVAVTEGVNRQLVPKSSGATSSTFWYH